MYNMIYMINWIDLGRFRTRAAIAILLYEVYAWPQHETSLLIRFANYSVSTFVHYSAVWTSLACFATFSSGFTFERHT